MFLWLNWLLRTKTDGKGTEKKLYMQMIVQNSAKKVEPITLPLIKITITYH